MSRYSIRFAACALFIAVRASAQATPLIMVHGFNSGPATWAFMDSVLTATGNYLPHTVSSINPSQALTTQASALATFFADSGFGPSTIFVAHSQGGLVARLAARSDSVAGILTIGSPHTGAPVAESGVEAYVVGLDNEASIDVYNIIDYLEDEAENCDYSSFFCQAAVAVYDDIDLSAGLFAVAIEAEIGKFYDGADVSSLVPGSALLNSLADSSGLERAALRYTITVDDSSEDDGGLRLVYDLFTANGHAYDIALGGAILVDAGLVFDDEADDGTDPYYDDNQFACFSLLELGGYLEYASDIWNENIIGDPTYTNDGLIPTANQRMPNDIPYAYFGASHTEETIQPILLARLNTMTSR